MAVSMKQHQLVEWNIMQRVFVNTSNIFHSLIKAIIRQQVTRFANKCSPSARQWVIRRMARRICVIMCALHSTWTSIACTPRLTRCPGHDANKQTIRAFKLCDHWIARRFNRSEESLWRWRFRRRAQIAGVIVRQLFCGADCCWSFLRQGAHRQQPLCWLNWFPGGQPPWDMIQFPGRSLRAYIDRVCYGQLALALNDGKVMLLRPFILTLSRHS
jgi:hypothetical protein